ncbi:hypothetical protein CcaverHIS631_0702130 [Cutaneotrichosporon cavernicola]|nr:hypothetical protein CcaverHIS631_0702130 [Cutaneotrichosporon cavernicola]BEJ10176.1 hypothetical protein CcaverHIS641_0702110 [Cutaneotrichosporon cavernicola]
MGSNYPHSTLATSLSTSPYTLQNNLEHLIQRRRASNAASHRPLRWNIDRTSHPADQSDVSVGDAIFPHDIEDGKPTSETSSLSDAGGRGRGPQRLSFTGRGARSPDYGAVSNSEPLQAPDLSTMPVPGAPPGTSRSRSKGRTPPRHVVRPMTRARRQAAIDAGASASAIASVEANGSVISVISEPDRERRTQSPPAMHGRGRNDGRRPISPHVAFRPLYQLEEDEEAAARAAARSNLYLPGTGGTGEPLSDDPAAVLEAEDLDLPIDACGQEVRTWRSALDAELPLLIRSTIPVFLTQLAEYSLSLASVVSIGHLGTKDLAASSLANMTAAVTCFSILQGLATSLDTLLPAAWTGSDRRHVGLWTMRCTVVMIVAMIPMFVLWFNIEVVLLWLRQDPYVASLAGTYLAWLSIGIPGYATNVVLRKYLQSQNIMHIPTYVLFVVAPINLLLNLLLVWGPAPIRLGFIGGAVATAFSFNLAGTMLFVYVMWWGPRDSLHPFSLPHIFSRLGTVTQLGLAGTVMLSSEWWAWEVCALAAALLGSTALAAQSVLLSTCATLYQFPAALGVAASVRVGNLLGAGRSWEAKWAARAAFILATVFALFNSFICVVFRHQWGYLFNSDPEVVAMVAEVMPWMGLFQIMDGLSGAANAIMRALALHSIGAIVNFTAYYGVGIPFGLWLTFRHHMSLVGIWIGLAVALLYGSLLGVTIVWRTDWDQGVERVRLRLGLGPLEHDTKYVDDSDGFDGHACAPNPPDGERSGDTSRIYRSPHAGWESDRSDPGTPRPGPRQLNGKYDPERQALLA